MRSEAVFEIQRLFPQIYLACHVDHVRAASTAWNLSSHDSSILVHRDRETPISPRALAKHLGVAASTLSAAITRLADLGYRTSKPAAADKRQRELRLTARGSEAIASTSVLDAERVEQLVNQIAPEKRIAAVRGLQLLAEAARQMKQPK